MNNDNEPVVSNMKPGFELPPKRTLIIILAVVALLVAGGAAYYLTKDDAGEETTESQQTTAVVDETALVDITSNSISPASAKIKAGATMTFTNTGADIVDLLIVTETGTSDDGEPWENTESVTIEVNEQLEVPYPTAGEYMFYLANDPNVVGTVIVE